MRTMTALLLISMELMLYFDFIQQGNGTEVSTCLKRDENGTCTCCDSGYRGRNCSHLYERCISRPVSGKCTYFCKSDKSGNAYYGNTCEKKCPETCVDSCNEKNGLLACDECIDGYYGQQCNLSCDSNCYERKCIIDGGKCLTCNNSEFHGYYCNIPCSKGCTYEMCNRTGHCTDGCYDTFYDTKCESKCGNTCVQGRCIIDTYSTYNCTEGCQNGLTGTNCSEKCPTQCETCDQQTGQCTSCVEHHVINADTGECTAGVSEERTPFLAVIIAVPCCIVLIIVVIALCIFFRGTLCSSIAKGCSRGAEKNRRIISYHPVDTGAFGVEVPVQGLRQDNIHEASVTDDQNSKGIISSDILTQQAGQSSITDEVDDHNDNSDIRGSTSTKCSSRDAKGNNGNIIYQRVDQDALGVDVPVQGIRQGNIPKAPVTVPCLRCDDIRNNEAHFSNFVLLHTPLQIMKDPEKSHQKRKFYQKFQNSFAALKNTEGGVIVVHIEGKDENILDIFNQCLMDGIKNLTDDRYKPTFLNDVKDSVRLDVEQADEIVTVDLNTKIREGTKNRQMSNIKNIEMIYSLSGELPQTRQPLSCLKWDFQDSNALRESQDIALKAIRRDCEYEHVKNDVSKLVDYIWSDLKLKDNISSMSKLKNGGSYFLGIKDKRDHHQTKRPFVEGFELHVDPEELVKTLRVKMQSEVCVLYQDSFTKLDDSFTQIQLHSNIDVNPTKYVLEVAIGCVKGVVFYDRGPRTYIMDENRVKRMDNEDWLERIKNTDRLSSKK